MVSIRKLCVHFILFAFSGWKDINHIQNINHIILCFRSFNHHFVTLLISLTHFFLQNCQYMEHAIKSFHHYEEVILH